jgi:hypothetical protein
VRSTTLLFYSSVHFSFKIWRQAWSKWPAPKRVVLERVTSRAPLRFALQSAATRRRRCTTVHACRGGPATIGSSTAPLGTCLPAMWSSRTRHRRTPRLPSGPPAAPALCGRACRGRRRTTTEMSSVPSSRSKRVVAYLRPSSHLACARRLYLPVLRRPPLKVARHTPPLGWHHQLYRPPNHFPHIP